MTTRNLLYSLNEKVMHKVQFITSQHAEIFQECVNDWFKVNDNIEVIDIKFETKLVAMDNDYEIPVICDYSAFIIYKEV
jgi:hypothetical protein